MKNLSDDVSISKLPQQIDHLLAVSTLVNAQFLSKRGIFQSMKYICLCHSTLQTLFACFALSLTNLAIKDLPR